MKYLIAAIAGIILAMQMITMYEIISLRHRVNMIYEQTLEVTDTVSQMASRGMVGEVVK